MAALRPARALAAAGPAPRIDSVEAVPVRLWARPDPAPPHFDSDFDPRRWRYPGPFAQLDGAMVVIVKTTDGAVGFGFGGGGAAAATIVHGHLRYLLLGADPRNTELLWDQMYSSGLATGGSLFVKALSGVDNALWDLQGKLAGQPVYRLLGGATRASAEAYYTSSRPEHGLELGFRNFKLPIPDGVRDGRPGMQRTAERLREVRALIGDGPRLMIDCGMGWNDVAYTVEMARRLEDLRLFFIEEPLSRDDVLGYAELIEKVGSTRIASGEHQYTQYDFAKLFHHRAIEVVQPDVSWCGGTTALSRISAMTAEHGLLFIPHRGGSLYGLPLVLSAPHAPLAEGFGTGDPGTDLMMAMSARFENGAYLPSEDPGFGTRITESLVRAHAHQV